MVRSTLVCRLPHTAAFCAAVLLAAVVPAQAQVFTVEAEHVEKHYTQFPPTNVRLSTEPMTKLTREQLIRFLQSEQGFAMRPLPVGVLTLRANGQMEPSGDKYVDLLHAKGISAKPGDRVVITDLKFSDDKLTLDLNGGPYHKHRFLRHLSIGMDPAYDNPVVPDDGTIPSGSRLILEFPKRIPDVNGEQVEALLKPMIDFGVKSPAEAYAETLPDFLRKAIEQHRVLVGMNKDMVRYAKGLPIRKIREEENGQSIEIWVYGEQPQPVEFVRFIGTFVVRDELARVGQAVVVRASNEMGDYWGNQPTVATNEHEVKMGDQSAAEVNSESARRAPPTLRNPGEKLPVDDPKNPQPVMAPVNMPKDQQRPGDPGYSPTVSAHPNNGSAQDGPAAGPSGAQQQPNPLDQGSPSGSGQQTSAPQH
jgi:hypothetical protein